MVVFTSYMKAKRISADVFDDPKRCFYPSIFFFNLGQQKIHWQIQGAEIFLGIYDTNKVYYMTNQIWQLKDRSEYRNFIENGDSRHSQFADIIYMTTFGADIDEYNN